MSLQVLVRLGLIVLLIAVLMVFAATEVEFVYAAF